VARLAGDASGSPSTVGGTVTALVYVVYVARGNLAGPTMRVTEDLCEAERWAAELSMDRDGLATQVIRFVTGYPHSRKPIALFVSGVRESFSSF
jgi:hypothetical protein